MDANRFDGITRALGDASSRRSLLSLAAGLLAAPLAATQADAKAGSKRPRPEGPCGNGKRKDNICTKGSQCCTGICNTELGKKNKDGKGRCRCVTRGNGCTEDKNCCNTLTCIAGTCGGGGTCAPEGATCTADADCCDGLPCTDGVCGGGTCLPAGGDCNPVDGGTCCDPGFCLINSTVNPYTYTCTVL
jgi:hypothetical protein